jgi:hypothetical protein
MMAIRIVCIVLMVAVTPYGWYTWVFGAGAVLLPYVAVVSANVSANVRRTEVESPERALPAVPTEYVAPTAPPVIRLSETPQLKATQDDVS